MTRATTLRIGDAKWKVKELPRSKLEEIAGAMIEGMTDFDEQTIYLDADMHSHRKGVVLVHEAMHVMYDRSGYNHKDEEKNILAVEHGVYNLINKFPQKYKGL